MKRFWLLKIIKLIRSQFPLSAPGIVTTLFLATLPLLALTTPDVLLAGLTQDTVRKATSRDAESASSVDDDPNPNQVRTVVLDAGHGGKDPGTHGRFVKEKNINLALILQLGKKIKDRKSVV